MLVIRILLDAEHSTEVRSFVQRARGSRTRIDDADLVSS